MRAPAALRPLTALLCLVAASVAANEYCSCSGDTVNCSSKGLAAFELEFVCNQNLTKIDLSDNVFDTFPDLTHSIQLTHVDLSQNSINDILPAALAGTSLVYLNLSSNLLREDSSEALEKLSSLQQLDVSRNQFSGLNFLPKPCELQLLNASYNQVTDIEPGMRCAQLTELQLAHNQLNQLPNSSMPSGLRQLDLSHNQLQQLPDDPLPNTLLELALSGNQLEILPGHLGRLPELWRLDVSGNKFKNLPELELPNLQQLNLSDNQLTTLPSGLSRLHNLTLLDISGNCLHQVPASGPWPSLQCANLSRNLMVAPAAEALLALLGPESGPGAGARRTVDLRGNPLQAGRWLAQLLLNESVSSELDPGNSCCGSFTRENVTLLLCLKTNCDNNTDWVSAVKASVSTTTTTTATTIATATTNTTTKVPSLEKLREANRIHAASIGPDLEEGSSALDALRWSLLGLLALTVLLLSVVNCVLQAPPPDDRWWEDRAPPHRPYT